VESDRPIMPVHRVTLRPDGGVRMRLSPRRPGSVPALQ
jgi:hypothetical protein